MRVFSVDGYLDGDKENLVSGFLVAEFDNTPKGYNDDDIYFYGMNEENIKECIKTKDDIAGLTPTNYEVVNA